jgi:quercetin dioxygenase-like cupin family protein
MISQGDQIENLRTGQKMIFLRTGKETNGELLEIDCYSPPTDTREPEHIHPQQENIFKIISGEVSFRINGKIQKALPGEKVSILPGVPHLFWNSGTTTAHYLQEFRPALRIDQLFQTFFALARDGKLDKTGAPNLFHASLIMLSHEKELRLSKPRWGLQKSAFMLLAPIGKLMGYKAYYE